jgi:hypothetical protein
MPKRIKAGSLAHPTNVVEAAGDDPIFAAINRERELYGASELAFSMTRVRTH